MSLELNPIIKEARLTYSHAIERPDCIPQEAWDAMPLHQLVLSQKAKLYIPPPGFHEEFWKNLTDDEKINVLMALEKKVTRHSAVYDFFLNFEDDTNFDNPVNALALICALLLTIPFGLITVLNGAFFQSLEEALNACPNNATKDTGDTYNYLFVQFLQNTGSIIYACLCGLILSAFYYTFKPSENVQQTRRSRFKLKILIGCLVCCTIAAVIGVMDVSSYMVQTYMVQTADLCTYDSSYVWATGVVFVVLSCVAGFGLMW